MRPITSYLSLLTFCILPLTFSIAATTNRLGSAVLINGSGETRPAQSIATPQQVQSAEASALTAYDIATNAQEIALIALQQAESCRDTVRLYSTNYMWQSRAYCEGVGGVMFDPSNQVMVIYYFYLGETNLILRGVAKQAPIAGAPVLDFRATYSSGELGWTNLTTYSTTEITVPTNYASYAKAYQYNVQRPAGTSLFARMRDSSSGMSGSGWAWLVYGDIIVNSGGQYYKGKTEVATNVWTVGGTTYTNVSRRVSGIECELEPLGD